MNKYKIAKEILEYAKDYPKKQYTDIIPIAFVDGFWHEIPYEEVRVTALELEAEGLLQLSGKAHSESGKMVFAGIKAITYAGMEYLKELQESLD